MGKNTIWEDGLRPEDLLPAARGSYQEGLLLGNHLWSGADLPGRYGASYSKSRSSLLKKLTAMGFTVERKPCKELRGRIVVTIRRKNNV